MLCVYFEVHTLLCVYIPWQPSNAVPTEVYSAQKRAKKWTCICIYLSVLSTYKKKQSERLECYACHVVLNVMS